MKSLTRTIHTPIYFFICVIVLFFVALQSFICHASSQKEFARSYMRTRPAYHHLSMRNFAWHSIAYATDKGATQAIGYYARSISQAKAAQYFLLDGKNELLVSGADWDDTDLHKRDIVAEWLNLPSSFRGKLCLDPEQRQAGIQFEFNLKLRNIIDLWFTEHMFISFVMPWQHVVNDLQLRQFDVQNANDDPEKPGDILQAFNQSAWKYSKICGSQEKSGIAEFKMIFGSTYMDERDNQLIYYSTLIIPTNAKPDPEFIFNPVVGVDKHVAIGAGVDMQFRLNRHYENGSFMFFVSLEGTFYIRNKQFRTFDLKDKPFSRFMLYNVEGCPEQALTPGVNLFTIQSLVRPYGIFDFSTGWRFKNRFAELEFGYNVWGHDDETIKLRRPFDKKIGIASLSEEGLASNGTITSSNSTIGMLEEDDEEFVRIRETDIDLTSARMRSALNHKFHATCSFIRLGDKVGGLVGFGGYIDFPQKNAPLRTWGIWAKVGLAF